MRTLPAIAIFTGGIIAAIARQAARQSIKSQQENQTNKDCAILLPHYNV